MSPRPQATGRPGTSVIPTSWDSAHAHVATGAMRARVNLIDPAATGDPVWVDDQWKTVPAGPYALLEPARVQRLNGQSRNVVSALDPETVVDHLVQLSRGFDDIRPGHLVKVVDCPDLQLVDQVLRVESVALGTEVFARDLFCTLT